MPRYRDPGENFVHPPAKEGNDVFDHPEKKISLEDLPVMDDLKDEKDAEDDWRAGVVAQAATERSEMESVDLMDKDASVGKTRVMRSRAESSSEPKVGLKRSRVNKGPAGKKLKTATEKEAKETERKLELGGIVQTLQSLQDRNLQKEDVKQVLSFLLSRMSNYNTIYGEGKTLKGGPAFLDELPASKTHFTFEGKPCELSIFMNDWSKALSLNKTSSLMGRSELLSLIREIQEELGLPPL